MIYLKCQLKVILNPGCDCFWWLNNLDYTQSRTDVDDIEKMELSLTQFVRNTSGWITATQSCLHAAHQGACLCL